jgi:hypothetical protein
MSRYADDRVYLRIKILRTPQNLDGNAVLLDIADRSLEVFFANEGQEPNKIVGAAEDPDAKTASSSARSASILLIADCKGTPHEKWLFEPGCAA